MATIHIDNRPCEADPRQNLLQAVLACGIDLPYFCWHPALGSVGACRQCAVKQFRDEQDTQGKLVMACMVPAADGTRISVDDPEAREFRRSVVEWLMTNHPHDCPVCDEGGECHLQDMTVMTGHAYRRQRFPKRTFRNQDLGPFINHEMNRCIQCYRCVRYYRDYAGGRDLDAFAAHNHVYFGRAEDGVLESEFSGNLVEVCPTGVFTDKTLKRHYTRKWDLQSAPSVCAHCSLGCNTIAGERYGTLRRILNRHHPDINGYFLCDRGRFGYDFVNHARRVREPAARDESGAAALRRVVAELAARRDRVIGIGSPRASLESNFALRRLVGPGRFHRGVPAREGRLAGLALGLLRPGPWRVPTLREVEEADAVLVLGEDVANTAPRLALALRQAARQRPLERVDGLKIPRWHDRAVRDVLQDETGPFLVAATAPTRLDALATRQLCARPDLLARAGAALAHALDPGAPEAGALPDDARSFVADAAAALRGAKRPLVVAGFGAGSSALLAAAANVARALRSAALAVAWPEANSAGAALLGGRPLEEAFAAVERGEADTVIILENDLYRRADATVVDGFLGRAAQVVVIDSIRHRTADAATLVLPAATFAEADGTWVNFEGRAQRHFPALPPDEWIRESWRWLDALAAGDEDGESRQWASLDELLADLVAEEPALAAVREAAPPASFRIAGLRVARASRRASGRTAVRAHVAVSEPRPPEDPDAPLSFSMEGYPGRPPSPLVTMHWAAGWNSVQSLNKFQPELPAAAPSGPAGVRLFPADRAATGAWLPPADGPEAAPGEGLLAVPLHEVFGSEELSALAPAVAARAPAPGAAVAPELARRLGVEEGGLLRVGLPGRTLVLPARIVAGLPGDVVGITVGLPDLGYVDLPAPAAVKGAG